jgi:hypothetical protein
MAVFTADILSDGGYACMPRVVGAESLPVLFFIGFVRELLAEEFEEDVADVYAEFGSLPFADP